MAKIVSVSTVSNVDKFIRMSKEAQEECGTIIGLRAERHAKAICPVVTGRLRDSITNVYEKGSVYVGTNVEYAPYVELGTSKRKAKPYLRPAIEDHLDEYKGIIEETYSRFK